MPNGLFSLSAGDFRRRTRIVGLTHVIHGYPSTEHKLGAQTGTAPLEDGARVTDHATPNTKELTLTGWVSDLVVGPSAAGDAWTEIERLNDASEPVRVITALGTYPEMIIKECTAQQVGRGMRFQMKLEQIIRVGVQRANIVAASGPAAQRTSEVNRGFINSRAVTELGGGTGERITPDFRVFA